MEEIIKKHEKISKKIKIVKNLDGLILKVEKIAESLTNKENIINLNFNIENISDDLVEDKEDNGVVELPNGIVIMNPAFANYLKNAGNSYCEHKKEIVSTESFKINARLGLLICKMVLTEYNEKRKILIEQINELAK